jgi:CRISPR-associated protein Cas1
MAAILNRAAAVGPERMTLLAATEAVAMSLVRAMEHNSAALLQIPCWTGDDAAQ